MRRLHVRHRVHTNTDENTQMDSTKLQTRPGSTRSTNLFPRNSKYTKSKIVLVSSLIVTLAALATCLYLLFFSYENRKGDLRYGVVIDGGSTGTRIHVFGYRVEGGKPVFDVGESGSTSLRVNPGLSSFAEIPDDAGGSIKELVEFAKGKVPKDLWGETEIRLMATAGLRLLEMQAQERILEASRRVLRVSGFNFRDEWASVISGADEGIYAWVVANYALGTLGGDPLKTTGIIELGGASAQVTLVSDEPMPPEFTHSVKYGNFTYQLYSHSFLHFGQNVAFESLRESLVDGVSNSDVESVINPCTPKGYKHRLESWKPYPGSSDEHNKGIPALQAGGNFSECRSAALLLLQKGKEKCSYEQCYIGSTYMPKLQGKFLATENFFYTSKFFELGQSASLSDLMMAGEQFCGEDWSTLKRKHPSLDEEDLLRYCFSSAYIVALLHDSFGIAVDDNTRNLHFRAISLQTSSSATSHEYSFSLQLR